MAREPLNDILIDCLASNISIENIALTISHILLSNTVTMEDAELEIDLTISATVPGSNLLEFADDEDGLVMAMTIVGTAVTNAAKTNWVGWSKIGQASFTIDRSNDAGFKAMEWPGYVYSIIPMDKNAVVYGSGGVTLMYPAAATFGFKEVLAHGIKNKSAVCGDKAVHFFIDKDGVLYKFSQEGLQRLGYEEFLYPLTNPVMLLDSRKYLLHISDETKGFIFHQSVLGGGYANLTGIKLIDSSILAIAPETVQVDQFEICTDAFDFGYRGRKDVEAIQFGIDTDETVYAAVDYKYDLSTTFHTTRWTRLNKEGVAHIRVSGSEFRFRLKSAAYIEAQLDYLGVQMTTTDFRFKRGEKGYDNPITA